MLVLEGLSVDLGKDFSLGPLDCEFLPGSCTVFIGSSGCGKSTLLRLVVGLLSADAGRVLIDGKEVTPEDLEETRLKMGYVIQDGGLFPHLNARQNVTLMAEHLGWPEARRRDRLAELCELTRFPDHGLDRFPAQLSGGQRQRLSLMRALMLDPDYLLLDEPLGALDPIIRFELQEELAAIFRSLGKTVLLVTHDLSEAGFFADRIAVMSEGKVVQEGSLDDLLERPADDFVRRFVTAQRGVHQGRQDS
ncbi:MAG: ATP-binding cassette domain-containing protein [Planctomycetota bacterium]|jgi:osmoprotectant transport system ATP-binding protein